MAWDAKRESAYLRDVITESIHGAPLRWSSEVERERSSEEAHRLPGESLGQLEDVQEEFLSLEGGWHPEGVHDSWRQGEKPP